MKKLINILSIFSLTATSSLSVISCSKKEIPKLSLTQEKTDIVNAINLKNTNNKNLNLKIADITMVKNPIFDGKNISYNIIINQNVKNFLNNNFTYRIPEVIGNFDISNNKISNKIFEINYLNRPLNLNNNSYGGVFLGSGQNCIIYLNDEIFKHFIHSDRPLGLLNDFDIKNKYVKINNHKWNSILSKIYFSNNFQVPNDNDGAIIIIKNGELYYTNVTEEHFTDLPLGPLNILMSRFISSNAISNNYLINKNILYELNDIYNSNKNNEEYGNKNWNIKNINILFEKSNYIINQNNINNEYLSLATSFYNLFQNNYDIVSNLLNYYKTHNDNDNGIFISFDKNNNYIKYMN